MLKAEYTSKFKKDLKLMDKRGLHMKKLYDVMVCLTNEIPLSPNHHEHLLQVEYKGFLECHIEPDWLLVYKINMESKEIYFSRTGTHSDLF